MPTRRGIGALTARRPSLHGVLPAAMTAGPSHVITDGPRAWTYITAARADRELLDAVAT